MSIYLFMEAIGGIIIKSMPLLLGTAGSSPPSLS
jgi:hypothetical protein